MPAGLKDELGLGEPKPQGSTEQADKFKAAFQAQKAKIDQALQYTAAHAEQAKHDPLAEKRDKVCSAFQMALGKIDPANPAVAQGAIDQVIAAVQALASAAEALKDAVQRAFEAWQAREGEVDQLVDKIREMVEWGHDKAAPLQKIIDSIMEKANCRKWEEAVQALDQLQQKFTAIYDEYCRQKAAQEEYDAAMAELEPRLAEVGTCEFQSLQARSQEITGAADAMRQAAESKDYVSALESQRSLQQQVSDYQDELEQLRAKKAEYEQCRAALDPRLGEASTCEFQSLADLDQEIADLTTRMDEAAAAEDYAQALEIANQLSTKVDEKLSRAAELQAKKAEYEQCRAALDPRLAEASTCEFKALAELDQEIADLTPRMDEAAAAEDYAQALEIANQLSAKVDEKLARAAELKAKKEEYETGRSALDPKLADASTCQYASLAELDQPIADLTTRMEEAAAAEDYEQAVGAMNELSTKVDEKLKKVADLEAKKAEYDAASQAIQPRLPTACPVGAKLGAIHDEIMALKGQMETAAQAEDYEKALETTKKLTAKLDEFEALQKKKEAYEAAAKALEPKMPTTCPVSPGLSNLHGEIMALTGQMEAAAKSEDYDKAQQIATKLGGKLDHYQKISQQKPPSAEEVKKVQDLITAGKKDDAIKKAMEVYGVDKSQAKEIVYDSSVSGEAVASKNGKVRVGDKAFSSPGWLASSTAHELEVHVNQQAKAGKWYTGKMGTAVQEVQAYDHEIANAHKYGLTEAEIKDLKKRRNDHYNELNDEYKKRADEGNYDMKKGEEGL